MANFHQYPAVIEKNHHDTSGILSNFEHLILTEYIESLHVVSNKLRR